MKPVIKQLLKEALFDKSSENQFNLLEKFVEFVSVNLKLKAPKIILKFNRKGLVTTASYGDNKTIIYAKERALVDIMRSIAHELTHMKQDADGLLSKDKHTENNSAGSNIENEANAKAGEFIRLFGKKYPEIYE